MVESFGIEGPAVPFAQFAVVWIGGIGESIEEAFEPGEAADVFWRALAFAVKNRG